MEVRIEVIREEHALGFCRVYDAVARERKYLSAVEGHSLERTRAFIANNVARGFPQFVAVSLGEVVGWCDIIPMSLPSHAHVGTLGMGLLPHCRGQGIGLALVAATLEAAHRFGLRRVELTVHADNLPAIGLYHRVGFTQEGIKKYAVCIDGVFKDVIFMARITLPDRPSAPCNNC